MRFGICVALVCVFVACKKGAVQSFSIARAETGQATVLVIFFGPIEGSEVAYPADALAPGTTVNLAPAFFPSQVGFMPAGEAVSINLSAPLVADTGTVTLPYNPCILRSRDRMTSDLSVLVLAAGIVKEIANADLTINLDNSVSFELDIAAVVLVVIPESDLLRFNPVCGMSASGIGLGRAEGSVFTWGSNARGQLGDGTFTSTRAPDRVEGIDNAVSVEVGIDFSIALLGDGKVLAWGSNDRGQLGDGTFVSSTRPVLVVDLPCIVRIAVGATSRSVLAEAHDGSLWAWGANSQGQIGNGTRIDQGVPFKVPGIMKPRSFAIAEHALAVLEDGAVKAWGANALGQLGLGTFSKELEPVTVPGLSDIIRVATGGNFSLAATDSGNVLSWGGNEFGQLGFGFVDVPRAFPGPTLILSDVLDVDATAFSGIARTLGGLVFTWGQGTLGQIGDGNNIQLQAIPLPVLTLGRVVDIDAGPFTLIAAIGDGTYSTWGFNGNGEIGDGTVIPRFLPRSLLGAINVLN